MKTKVKQPPCQGQSSYAQSIPGPTPSLEKENSLQGSKPRGRLYRLLLSLFLCLCLSAELTPLLAASLTGRSLYLVTSITKEGSQTPLSYDAHGLLLLKAQEGAQILSYGSSGYVTSFRTSEGFWSLSWSKNGALKKAATSGTGFSSKSYSYSYDTKGNVKSLTYEENGTTTKNTYQNTYQGNRLTKRTNTKTGAVTTYQYQLFFVPEEALAQVEAQQACILNYPELPLAASTPYFPKASSLEKQSYEETGEKATTTLAAPKGVTATLTKENGILLTWKTVKNAKKYMVYAKGPSETSYKKLKTLTKTTLTIKASTLTAGKTYSYYVLAVDKNGNKGKKSSKASITTLGKIKKAQAQAISAQELLVSWKANAHATSYEVALTVASKASKILPSEITAAKANHLSLTGSYASHKLYVRAVQKNKNATAYGPWTKVT